MVLKELCGNMLTISKVCKEESHNPIQQDVSSNSKPRELADIPPFHGYPCNYGAFPQVSRAPFNVRVLFDPSLWAYMNRHGKTQTPQIMKPESTATTIH